MLTVLYTILDCLSFHFPHLSPPPTTKKQLTPLAELSIPRRSTTAPTGLPANIVPGGPAGALMSPHQFAHSTSTTAVAERSSGGQGEEGSKVTTTKGAEPVGLSREQLQQAMLYLIKVGGVPCNNIINEQITYKCIAIASR